MQLDEPQSSIRYFIAASIILSVLIYLYFSAGPVQDDWRCRRSIYLSNISEIIRIGISFKFIAASRTKMFLFWFICIFLQNDRRCNRSFYLSTNILKIIRKCACAAGSDACQRMVLRICERCRNVPDFYQRDAFLIFAPLLLCSNLFFFWQVEHSGSLWRVCGLCACCGLWEHCDVTVFSMMRSKKWCFWRLLGKKWNFSLKNSCFRLRVRRRRNRLAFPDIPLWLKHFFLGIAAHRAAWNLNIVTNSLNNTVMRWEGWARPKWLLSGIGAINTTSQCHSQARRLLS